MSVTCQDQKLLRKQLRSNSTFIPPGTSVRKQWIHLDSLWLIILILWLPLQDGLYFSIPQNCNCVGSLLCIWSKCLETLCFGKPFIIFSTCSLILTFRALFVLPTYWRLQLHCSTYTTPSVWHPIKSLMTWVSPVFVATNSVFFFWNLCDLRHA